MSKASEYKKLYNKYDDYVVPNLKNAIAEVNSALDKYKQMSNSTLKGYKIDDNKNLDDYLDNLNEKINNTKEYLESELTDARNRRSSLYKKWKNAEKEEKD